MHVCMVGKYVSMGGGCLHMYVGGTYAHVCMGGYTCICGVILTNVLSGWEELSLSLSENMYSLPFSKVRRQGNEHILMKFIDRQQLLVYIFNAATSNTNKSDNHKICFLVLVL